MSPTLNRSSTQHASSNTHIRRLARGFTAFFASCWAFLLTPAHADIFILENDGQIEGELVNQPATPQQTLRIQTKSGGLLEINSALVKRHIPTSPVDDQYEQLRVTAADTVAGQWELAEWCRVKNLNKQREVHLQRVIELDPNHRDARVALGYAQVNGQWQRQEDKMIAEGYVLYKGKWLLPQEIEVIEQARQKALKQKEWFTTLNKLRADALRGSPPQKAQEALQKLKELNDPHAVPALLQSLKTDSNQQMLVLYLEALSRTGGNDAVKVLVNLAMGGGNENLRDLALDLLKAGHHPQAVGFLATELRSKDNKRVNRAGYALGEIADPAAVPVLIEALITKHKYQISAGDNGAISSTFSSGGGGGFGVGGKPKIIEEQIQNFQVLSALTKITGQNELEYNQPAWRAWYAANQKKPVISGRRD